MSAAPRVVVVDHYDSYTWNLVHLLAGVTGEMPEVVQHDRTTAAHVLSFDYVVLSPGPGHPDDPTDFTVGSEVVRAATVPVLGICLGMQGLVTSYGGTVERVTPAHGTVASVNHDGRGVFAGIPSPHAAVRYHSLAATRIPSELVVTATCTDPDAGQVVMGVRHRTRPLHGVQFHPESVLSDFGRQLASNFLGAGSRRPR
jgi:anthranilate synthase component 2